VTTRHRSSRADQFSGDSWYGIPRTFQHPAMVPATARLMPAANSGLLMRVQDQGTITKIYSQLVTAVASTVASFGVYRNTGAGYAARPTGACVAQASIATATAGLLTATIASTAVNVGDWLAVASASATIGLAGNSGLALAEGFAYSHATLLSGTTLGTIVPGSLVKSPLQMALWGGP
jgi:hypothetical protein